jgi:cell division transport system permease protein
LELLRASPLVAQAELVGDVEMQALLGPWLGEGVLPEGLPIPKLIDITLQPDVGSVAPLREALSSVDGVSFDDHGRALKEVRELAWLVIAVAYGIVALIAMAAALIVWLLVRTGLAVHRETVELLHMVGATDGYVARQFVRHITGLAVQGTVIGAAAAVGIVLLLQHYGSTVQMGLSLPPLGRQGLAMAGLIVPLVGVVLAMLTAQFVSLRLIRRMT